jgi:hypothetical protein
MEAEHGNIHAGRMLKVRRRIFTLLNGDDWSKPSVGTKRRRRIDAVLLRSQGITGLH